MTHNMSTFGFQSFVLFSLYCGELFSILFVIIWSNSYFKNSCKVLHDPTQLASLHPINQMYIFDWIVRTRLRSSYVVIFTDSACEDIGECAGTHGCLSQNNTNVCICNSGYELHTTNNSSICKGDISKNCIINYIIVYAFKADLYSLGLA